MAESLHELPARTDLGPLVRFVDGIIAAVERVQWSPILVIRRPVSFRIFESKGNVWKVIL